MCCVGTQGACPSSGVTRHQRLPLCGWEWLEIGRGWGNSELLSWAGVRRRPWKSPEGGASTEKQEWAGSPLHLLKTKHRPGEDQRGKVMTTQMVRTQLSFWDAWRPIWPQEWQWDPFGTWGSRGKDTLYWDYFSTSSRKWRLRYKFRHKLRYKLPKWEDWYSYILLRWDSTVGQNS